MRRVPRAVVRPSVRPSVRRSLPQNLTHEHNHNDRRSFRDAMNNRSINLIGRAATRESGGSAGGGAADHELAITSTFGTLLSMVYLVGVSGNVYTLVVMCHSIRFATSMYISIINLALADLLYLSTIPFVVSTYFLKDWYFGDVGCRILLSLDLLTMHASIFTLTVMCTERYLAVTKPLDAVRRSKSYRKALAWGVWLLSLVLTVPMMVMVTQTTKDTPDGGVKRMCAPTWAPLAYKVGSRILLTVSPTASRLSTMGALNTMGALSTMGARALSCSAPWLWSSLPHHT